MKASNNETIEKRKKSDRVQLRDGEYLNLYKNEVLAFLNELGNARADISQMISMVDHKFARLKQVLSDECDPSHALYDVLFLLFELACECNVDLDKEWALGVQRKKKKYLKL